MISLSIDEVLPALHEALATHHEAVLEENRLRVLVTR